MKNIILIILSYFFFIGCTEQKTGGGSLYEGQFVDEIMIINKLDSTNIVLEYYKYQANSIDTIPYSYVSESLGSDMLKLKLFITYGSYTPEPKINKEAMFNSDTVYVWYSYFAKHDQFPEKESFTVAVESEPLIEYLKIDSIWVVKSAQKNVRLVTRAQNI